MAWTSLTVDDVLSVMNNAELAAASSIALKPGQTIESVSTNILQWATDEVRGAAKAQMVPPGAGVPPALVLATLDIVVYRLLLRVSTAAAKERKDAFDDAQAKLKDAMTGDFRIDQDDTLSGVPTINDPGTTLDINVRTISRTTCEGM